jgi:hypothetical protein
MPIISNWQTDGDSSISNVVIRNGKRTADYDLPK